MALGLMTRIHKFGHSSVSRPQDTLAGIHVTWVHVTWGHTQMYTNTQVQGPTSRHLR